MYFCLYKVAEMTDQMVLICEFGYRLGNSVDRVLACVVTAPGSNHDLDNFN